VRLYLIASGLLYTGQCRPGRSGAGTHPGMFTDERRPPDGSAATVIASAANEWPRYEDKRRHDQHRALLGLDAAKRSPRY